MSPARAPLYITRDILDLSVLPAFIKEVATEVVQKREFNPFLLMLRSYRKSISPHTPKTHPGWCSLVGGYSHSGAVEEIFVDKELGNCPTRFLAAMIMLGIVYSSQFGSVEEGLFLGQDVKVVVTTDNSGRIKGLQCFQNNELIFDSSDLKSLKVLQLLRAWSAGIGIQFEDGLGLHVDVGDEFTGPSGTTYEVVTVLEDSWWGSNDFKANVIVREEERERSVCGENKRKVVIREYPIYTLTYRDRGNTFLAERTNFIHREREETDEKCGSRWWGG